jgi:hypothetical protein
LTLYVLAVGLAPFPYATLIFLWLLIASLASCYIEGEGREMVEAFRLGPLRFLRMKTILHMRLTLVLVLFPLVLHGLFQPRELIPILVFTVMAMLNSALFVVSKYAVWKPGQMGSVNEMIFSLAIISIVVPFLIPLPLFFLIRNTIRAKKNLTPWLHDFNY